MSYFVDISFSTTYLPGRAGGNNAPQISRGPARNAGAESRLCTFTLLYLLYT